MKDIIGLQQLDESPWHLSIKYNIFMKEENSWEEVVSSLICQLQNIETILENQNLSVREFIQENDDKACPAILEAQLRSTEVSFKRMEDKLHDMIIYLCRAMTVSKVHKLSNLLGEVDHGMEQ